MGIAGKVCTKGVWDETVPGISFDETGSSNYSKIFEKMLYDFPRGEKGMQDWERVVSVIKNQNQNKKYDCIIGVSGGTDSSYLLHLAHECGLRPLAVYLDNGWASNIALENIEKLTKVLNIDLYTYVIDYEEVKLVLKSYLKARLPWADSPTDLAIKALLYKKARQMNLKHILVGHDFRSEGFQPNEWTYSDAKQLHFLVRLFYGKKLKRYPTISIWEFGYLSFIRGIKLVRPFFYLPYAKLEAKKFLAKKYGWRDYGGHHYENIFTKFVISYWLFEKFGIDKRKITLSGLVMSGEIEREEALRQLENEPFDAETIESDINYILKKLDLSREEFDKLFIGEKKYFFDYPSYYPLYIKFQKIIFNSMKYFLPNKPLMFYQMEERQKKS